MTCRKARDWIHRHRDGEADPRGPLTERERVELDRHVDGCSACADYARELHEALALLRESVEATPSENFDWKLKLRLSQAMRETHEYPIEAPARGWWWGLRFGLATALAAALVLVVGTRMIDLPRVGPAETPESLLAGGRTAAPEEPETVVVQRNGTIRFPDGQGNPVELDIDRIPGALVVNGPRPSGPIWQMLKETPRARSDSLDFFGGDGRSP